MTQTEYIREHLLKTCANNPMDYKNLKKSEWSDEFEQLMRNRLVQGAFRYGLLAENKLKNCISLLEDKLKVYKETGNIEMLVDIANIALVEFVIGKHPLRHFKVVNRKGD